VSHSTLSQAEADRILDLLEKFHLPLVLSPQIATQTIMDKLSRDKKFASGQIRFVLLDRAGSAHVSSVVQASDLLHAIEHLRSPRC
jgi:3-dehydroquinate synthase